MSTLATPAAGAGERGIGAAVHDGLLVARRNLTRLWRNPGARASAVLFPLIFLFGFMSVLRRTFEAQGIDYAQYLPPIVVVQAMFFAAISSALSLADDKAVGVLDRCRSLPVHRTAPLLGRIAADLVRSLVSLVVLVAAAHVIGFRFHAGAVAAVGFVAIALLFTGAAVAACAAVGLSASNPEAVPPALMLPYLPLLMLSTGFVPVAGFPGWLQPFVRWQPVSLTADALRALATGGATATPLARAVVVLSLVFAAFTFLGTRIYRRLS